MRKKGHYKEKCSHCHAHLKRLASIQLRSQLELSLWNSLANMKYEMEGNENY